MKNLFFGLRAVIVAGALGASAPAATVVMQALSTFGGDGWLAPGETGYLASITAMGSSTTTPSASERSIAYSANTDHLYITSRQGGVRMLVLDPYTGQEVGALDTTGVSGGALPINMVSASASGAIYASNVASPVGTNSFRIYRWADEASPPTIAFESTDITTGRMGDTLDLIGDGLSTLLVAGESDSTGSGARNGYAVLSTTDGASFSGQLVSFTGTPAPAAGDFRIGITFLDRDSVIGSKGAGIRFSSFAAGTGTLDSTFTPTVAQERPMDFAVIGGIPILATLETNGNTTTPAATFSTVRLYDLTDPASPTLLASGRTATTWETQGTSGPGTGGVAWGKISGSQAYLYAISANNGIQAFLVSVPEPTTGALLSAAMLISIKRRRRACQN
jgi:hypothetical protein